MSSVRIAALGAAGLGLLYGASNCLFNVEGGHRGIVFNRLGGIKEAVRGVAVSAPSCARSEHRQLAIRFSGASTHYGASPPRSLREHRQTMGEKR
jgi:hypothetical protein